jgi:hypothetical protein
MNNTGWDRESYGSDSTKYGTESLRFHDRRIDALFLPTLVNFGHTGHSSRVLVRRRGRRHQQDSVGLVETPLSR